MIVIMGATGNTGSVVARRLLALGKPVRAVARDLHRLDSLRHAGAEVAVAEAADCGALTRAFEGAKAAYVLLPSRPKDPELLGTGEGMATAISEALAAAKVSHAVLLSRIGA